MTVKKAPTRGKAVCKSLMVHGSCDAHATLTPVVLQKVMTDFVQEHIEQHELAQRIAGPRNDCPIVGIGELDARTRTVQALALRRREAAGQQAGRRRLIEQHNAPWYD